MYAIAHQISLSNDMRGVILEYLLNPQIYFETPEIVNSFEHAPAQKTDQKCSQRISENNIFIMVIY